MCFEDTFGVFGNSAVKGQGDRVALDSVSKRYEMRGGGLMLKCFFLNFGFDGLCDGTAVSDFDQVKCDVLMSGIKWVVENVRPGGGRGEG